MAYKNHEIVDLSQDIYQGQPVFVGHPETWRWTNMTHEESAASGRFQSEMSYYSGIIQFCEHGPTHVDSISHLDPSPDAPHIDEMNFDSFYSRGIAIDFENVEDNSYINADDVKRRLDHYGYESGRAIPSSTRTGTSSATTRLPSTRRPTQAGRAMRPSTCTASAGPSTWAPTPPAWTWPPARDTPATSFAVTWAAPTRKTCATSKT